MQNRPSDPATLLTTTGTDWAGFPFVIQEAESATHDYGMEFTTYWLALVVGGTCKTTLESGRKSRALEFVPGTLAAYPPGVHWDRMVYVGHVKSIVFNINCAHITDTAAVTNRITSSLKHSLPCEKDRLMFRIAQLMVDEVGSGCLNGSLYAESLSIALASRLQKLLDSASPNIHDTLRNISATKVRSLRDLIEAEIDKDLSVSRLAQQIGLSPSYFAECFRQTFGCSVHQYVLSKRVNRAMELFAARRLSAAEIALACGFASQSHMSTAFKRTTGVSPTVYARTF
ncbi:UNVERIFIED_ORG: AraC family transcriptional regulator [Paraburkholderia sediminicola]|nr:AraC family transcriptional regulator [Paraburkholderia sediminicola]